MHTRRCTNCRRESVRKCPRTWKAKGGGGRPGVRVTAVGPQGAGQSFPPTPGGLCWRPARRCGRRSSGEPAALPDPLVRTAAPRGPTAGLTLARTPPGSPRGPRSFCSACPAPGLLSALVIALGDQCLCPSCVRTVRRSQSDHRVFYTEPKVRVTDRPAALDPHL